MNTRDKLILACEELVIKRGRGFYTLSMDELAQEAGISKRTIYRHFAGKEDLVEAMVDKVMGDIVAKNMELINSDKEINEIIVGMLKNAAYLVNQQFIWDLRTYYPLLWQKIDKIRASKIELLITTLFTNSHKQMRWRVDSRIFKASFIAAMTVVLTPAFIVDSGMSFEEAGKDFLDMFLYGAVEIVPDNIEEQTNN